MVAANTFVGPIFVACKSACGVTVVTTMALVEVPSLFVGTVSSTALPAETRLVNVPLGGAVTVTVKFVNTPLVKLAIGHVTRPLVKVKPALAVTNVTPVGNVSVTTTLVAVDGPRLVSAIV